VGTIRYRGPDVLVIGWIPFHLHPPALAGYPAGLATQMLFNSGNPNPPIAFDGYGGFENWIHPGFLVGTKEYRAALYMQEIAAAFHDDGSPPSADCGPYDTFLGYTPYRFFVGNRNVLAGNRTLPDYGCGYGPKQDPYFVVDPTGNGNWVELRYRAEFKLSRLANLLSRALTGFWAPYAWCEIVCRFERNGNLSIVVNGTAVPSQRLYVNWRIPPTTPTVTPVYDMRNAAFVNVNGFIQNAGWGCTPAPQASHLQWSGNADPW
jgi:hypothetical protein